MQALRSADDWKEIARSLYEEVKTLSDALRIEIDGYIGFYSWTHSIEVKEGVLRLSFFFNPNSEFKCSAVLTTIEGDLVGSEKVLGQAVIEG